MKYWWVSQNGTFKQESAGGYLWSPKVNKNGGKSFFYDNMTLISVGDLVLSFESSKLSAISVVTKAAVSSQKPSDFGSVGDVWSDDGWRVDLSYHFLDNKIRPATYIDRLRTFLPSKYSPLQPNGRGNQAYLFELAEPLFQELVDIIGSDEINALIIAKNTAVDFDSVDNDIESQIRGDDSLSATTVEQLIKSRRGQGTFRLRVEKVETKCRVTEIQKQCHLIASHIKPWSISDNEERLDGNNGLMLAPHIDHLFDKGFISFSDEGDVLVSPSLEENVIHMWKLNFKNVGFFNVEQRRYLAYHRINVFID
jgi:putative restriction endonuclease